MRLLITIPHFFDPQGNGRYGSTQANPQPRIQALTHCLRALRTLYDSPQEMWYRDGERLYAQPANHDTQIELDIVLCTCRDFHILQELSIPNTLFQHHPTTCEPLYLGFECHEVLRAKLGDYDLYGYMEDDLILHDPYFFAKLLWFNTRAGDECVLQPHRFERAFTTQAIKKVYIDFEFHPSAVLAERAKDPISASFLNQTLTFARTSNAHSGCFFLTRSQMEHWVTQDYFLDRNASYVGPLESAATLGLMRTFKVYKPGLQQASFLEIEHSGQMWSQQLQRVRFSQKSG